MNIISSNPQEKSCGTCTACCTTHAVPEIDKPTYLACQNLCENGCAKYESRPKSCADFQCLWKSGQIEGPYRPDEFGVVLATTNEIIPGVLAITVHEVRESAFDEPRVLYLLKKISRSYLVIMQSQKRLSFMGPWNKFLIELVVRDTFHPRKANRIMEELEKTGKLPKS